jgi:tetratricopeptide (TPR) repeat protein
MAAFIFFLVVGAACLAGMIFIVVRKFPVLSIFNAEDLPEEQSAKKKAEIIQGRVTRKATEIGRRLAAAVNERAERTGRWMTAAQTRLEGMQRQYLEESGKAPVQVVDPKEKAAAYLAEAERLAKLGDAAAAEEKFVEAVSWDAKELRAYRGLAELYATTRRHDQALQTWDFLAKLLRRENGCRHDDAAGSDECTATTSAHAEIAGVLAQAGASALEMKDAVTAEDRLAKAVSFEPMNPRYLDLLLDALIAGGERKKASVILDQLRSANPDNGKIPLFEQKIKILPENGG